jgi:transposase
MFRRPDVITNMSHDDRHSLPHDAEQLTALLLFERSQHEAERAQREAELAQREAVISAQHETLAAQQQAVAALEHQLARLLRKQYGPQKERIDPNQLTLFSVEEIEQLAAELQHEADEAVSEDEGSDDDGSTSEGDTTRSGSGSGQKPKRNGHGRKPLPKDLPRVVEIHELSEDERICPCCGKLKKCIGYEISEQLEFVPSSLQVIEQQREKGACNECEGHVAIATTPPQPIPKGLPGPGLLAHVVLSKYGDYLPLYRQEDILSRHGILIRRSTLCDWVAAAADLLTPLYNLMCDRVRASHVIHTDDTSIRMLAPGGCLNCKFWTYLGDTTNPYAVYEFSLTREGKEPSRFLEGFAGYLQADAFSGYDQVYAPGRILEVACMAHCRRYWWEAKETDAVRAHEAISYIGRLYALEEQFAQAHLSDDALRDARQKHAVPILNDFAAWLEREHAELLPKSPISQAFTDLHP